jgi:hypothetical protein
LRGSSGDDRIVDGFRGRCGLTRMKHMAYPIRTIEPWARACRRSSSGS